MKDPTVAIRDCLAEIDILHQLYLESLRRLLGKQATA